MLLYRVFPHHPSASAGQPGHWSYLNRPQLQGRLDNTTEHDCWYLARDASGAVGEAFGNQATWTDAMFPTPWQPGGRRALGTFQIDDNAKLLDLDDSANLAARGLRPTQVVIRNLAVTQAWALSIFQEKTAAGARLWDGVKWWSFQRPQWEVYGLWNGAPECVKVEDLDLDHPAVIDAAQALTRPLP